MQASATALAALVAHYSQPPSEIPPGQWRARVLFHGTSAAGAAQILREGIRNDRSGRGYFGPGFYCTTDAELARSNYADLADGDAGVVLAIRLNSHARIVDLRVSADIDRYNAASDQGNAVARRDFDRLMTAAGISGLFDNSFQGVVIYDPRAATLLGQVAPAARRTPQPSPI